MVKNLPTSAGDAREVGLIPGSGRFPGVQYVNLPQYSCLENSMDRGELVGYSPWGHRIRHYRATNTFTFFTYICSFFFFQLSIHTHTHYRNSYLEKQNACLSRCFQPVSYSFVPVSVFHSAYKEKKRHFFSSYSIYSNCIYLASVASFMLICLIYKEQGNCNSTTTNKKNLYGSSGAEVGVSG